MPAGQPTKYREKYCELVIELAGKGMTHVQIAAELGVAERTIYQWKDDQPKFSQALMRAKTISKARFMRIANDNLDNRNFNANLLKLILSHNYKEDTSKIRKLTSIKPLEQIKEIFEQYTNGLVTIETAERATKLIAFRLDEESRRKLDYLFIQSKNSE